MAQPWRLIPLMQASGSWQMAIDRWLLDRHCQGQHPPTLRFYTWAPVAISLGYHQKQYPEVWQHLQWQGRPVDLIQRPTGGRAVLHQGDLTYAVIASGFSARRRESYEQICEFLIQGWQDLGVELRYGAAGRGYINQSNCFGTATAADLVMPDGAKFIGSAQLHKEGAVLQHGSMRMHQDIDLFAQVFGERSTMPQLPTQFTHSESYAAVSEALIRAAQNCFDAALTIAPLTPIEQAQINNALVSVGEKDKPS